jgi:hypothetical protein
MKPLHTRVQTQEDAGRWPRETRAAVSLHCHTQYSKELLSFIPQQAAKIPFVAAMLRSELDRYLSIHGNNLDFAKAWWRPPASPRHVVEIERLQIEKEFGLPAMVSITDHDSIEAGLLLQVLDQSARFPISMEWTAPYEEGFFHLGVHNLPRDRATDIAAELLKYSNRAPDAMRLHDLLVMLDEAPEILTVLNHPFWDIEGIGQNRHSELLGAFLGDYESLIHAFEVNGFRSWKENAAVIRLAEDFGYPAVAGGDRHGLQPNVLLNLTRASSFEEYIAEIREDLHSDVMLMPEYRQSLIARTLEVAADVLSDYSAHSHQSGVSSRWTDRVFADLSNGCGPCPLSQLWPRGGPRWVRWAVWCVRMLGDRRLQPALRMALAQEKVGYEI